MSRPKVTITYFGDDSPSIIVSPTGSVEIELIDGEEGNWLFLKHGGVSVYHTEKDRECLSEYWFNTLRGCDWDQDGCFDIREIPEVPEIAAAIYPGQLPG